MLRTVPEGFRFPHLSLSLGNAVDVGVPLNFGSLKLTKTKLCGLCAADVGCELMLRCPVKISGFFIIFYYCVWIVFQKASNQLCFRYFCALMPSRVNALSPGYNSL